MAIITLRKKRFEQLLTEHHAESNVAAGKLLELHDATISKVRSGKSRPGEIFIGAALVALPVTFDELFKVTK